MNENEIFEASQEEEEIEVKTEEEVDVEESELGAGADEPKTDDEEVLPDDFSLEFRHDGELFQIGRDEAVSLAEKGKLFEKSEIALDTLNIISERMGTTPEGVLQNLLDSIDKSDLERCIEEAGGDAFEGQKRFNELREKSRTDYESKKAQRAAENNLKEFTEKKLADEFLKYKDELGYKTVDDIPQNVINIALKEKISLFDAQLRYSYSENKKIDKNKEKAIENAKRSSGAFKQASKDDDYSSHSSALLDA